MRPGDILKNGNGNRIYPIISAIISYPDSGKARVLPSCCFHDLFNANDEDLAGMGLAIIGNLCVALEGRILDPMMDAHLQLQIDEGSEPIEIPWPGMPDDRPIKLDLTQMPFDSVMFLDKSENRYKYRPNRLMLMRRIMAVWVPYLKSKMLVAA